MSLSPANGSEDVPGAESSIEQDSEALPRRIPHLGHALLFLSFTGAALIVLELVFTVLGRAPGAVLNGVTTLLHPRLQIALLAATYLSSLLAASLFYPRVWKRGFLDGLQWRWAAARGQAGRLIGLGLLLGIMVQFVTYFITPPKSRPIDAFFLTQTDAWLITLFGTLVAPAFEEICFRGFLVPACAIAYDWLSLPRTEQARLRWQTTNNLTPASLIFSAILTSIFFAMMHFQQVAHLWAALLVLFTISLLLTFVRVKTGSVAASALVHGAYNGFVFLMVIVQTGGYRHLDRMMK